MEIHIARDGAKLGEFPLGEVQRKLDAGELRRTDLAWVEGSPDWVPLENIQGLVWPGPPPMPGRAPVAPAASYPLQPAPLPAMAPPTSGLAITSLIFGLISITMMLPFLSSISAVICGHLARTEIRRSNGTLAGDGLALTGLITGYITFFGLILLIVLGFVLLLSGLVMIPWAAKFVPKSLEMDAISNGRQVAMACSAYAVDHHGAFPADLEELVPKYVPDHSVFECRLSGNVEAGKFEYLGGRDTDPGRNVLFYSTNQNAEGKRIVGRVDGSAKLERLPPDVRPPPR